jgi:Xaa-Pro aminopeptidase
MEPQATLLAGVPALSKTLYHRLNLLAYDPAVCIDLLGSPAKRIVIVRDVELSNAKKSIKNAEIYVPADFAPTGGLSGDREIATAQSAVECLRRLNVFHVLSDRSLPFLYVHLAQMAGITIRLDPELGIRERRRKSKQEVSYIRTCQHGTESAIRLACQTISRAVANRQGVLQHEGEDLTAEVIKRLINLELMKHGLIGHDCIVAPGPIGADCHHPGKGPIRTGEPVIVDVFPISQTTLYHGDCTRTVVHGQIPEPVRQMHQIVCQAKQSAERTTRSGVSGHEVHQATVSVMQTHRVHIGFPPPDAPADLWFLPHGTGHGIGLDLKEPPLLDFNGVPLVTGDCVTIEPAIYCHTIGGVRIEDMYIVHENGVENLNTLHDGLTW